MKRLLLNGSPRGKDANSRRILAWIAQGLGQSNNDLPILDLAPDPTRAAAVDLRWERGMVSKLNHTAAFESRFNFVVKAT